MGFKLSIAIQKYCSNLILEPYIKITITQNKPTKMSHREGLQLNGLVHQKRQYDVVLTC